MDKLKTRLKQDADEIQADTSPELRARIDASLHAARGTRSVTSKPLVRPVSLWWISSVTGLTAAILVILLMNWNQPVEQEAPDISASNEAPTHSVTLPEDWYAGDGFLLNVESADLTRSLEEELINLQSDLEKAKENVERDVKFAF
jgi:hypothetical protein